MNRALIAGALAFAVGTLGYVAGVYAAYPGRAFSVTAIMIGITLLAIGNARGYREGLE